MCACDSCASTLLVCPLLKVVVKMAAENLNKSKLKTNTTRKSTFTLVTLQSFSISGEISAEKMYVEN